MDIKLIRGDTYTLKFKILTADGAAYVLHDGDKLYFTVKKTFNHRDFVLQKTYGDGITYNGTTGDYEIELTQMCSCELDCGDYVYDIKAVLANDDNPIVETLVRGTLVFENNATHKGNE